MSFSTNLQHFWMMSAFDPFCEQANIESIGNYNQNGKICLKRNRKVHN